MVLYAVSAAPATPEASGHSPLPTDHFLYLLSLPHFPNSYEKRFCNPFAMCTFQTLKKRGEGGSTQNRQTSEKYGFVSPLESTHPRLWPANPFRISYFRKRGGRGVWPRNPCLLYGMPNDPCPSAPARCSMPSARRRKSRLLAAMHHPAPLPAALSLDGPARGRDHGQD